MINVIMESHWSRFEEKYPKLTTMKTDEVFIDIGSPDTYKKANSFE